ASSHKKVATVGEVMRSVLTGYVGKSSSTRNTRRIMKASQLVASALAIQAVSVPDAEHPLHAMMQVNQRKAISQVPPLLFAQTVKCEIMPIEMRALLLVSDCLQDIR